MWIPIGTYLFSTAMDGNLYWSSRDKSRAIKLDYVHIQISWQAGRGGDIGGFGICRKLRQCWSLGKDSIWNTKLIVSERIKDHPASPTPRSENWKRMRLSEKRKTEEEDEVGMVLDCPVVVTAPRWAVFSFSIGGQPFRPRQQTWSLAIPNAYIVWPGGIPPTIYI